MRWQVWGKDGRGVGAGLGSYICAQDETPTITGRPMGQFMAEEGYRLLHEFETSEEGEPRGLGTPDDEARGSRHAAVAFMMAAQYAEGHRDGEASPNRTCAVHAGQVHGREAEELRSGIEEALDSTDDHAEAIGAVRRVLQQVDSRDSLAFIETTEGRLHGYIRYMRRGGGQG